MLSGPNAVTRREPEQKPSRASFPGAREPGRGQPYPKPRWGRGHSLLPSSTGAPSPSQTEGQIHVSWVNRARSSSEDAGTEAPTPVPHGTGNCPLLGPQAPLSSGRTKANDDSDDDYDRADDEAEGLRDAERHVPAPYARQLISSSP